MTIVVCGSMTALPEMKEVEVLLKDRGYEVVLPRLVNGEAVRYHEASAEHKMKHNLIAGYYEKIKASDAILVLNVERKGIPGYVGGNAFLEMGFAHVLGKPIYLWEPLPNMSYFDEMAAMQPVVIDRDITKIQL